MDKQAAGSLTARLGQNLSQSFAHHVPIQLGNWSLRQSWAVYVSPETELSCPANKEPLISVHERESSCFRRWQVKSDFASRARPGELEFAGCTDPANRAGFPLKGPQTVGARRQLSCPRRAWGFLPCLSLGGAP